MTCTDAASGGQPPPRTLDWTTRHPVTRRWASDPLRPCERTHGAHRYQRALDLESEAARPVAPPSTAGPDLLRDASEWPLPWAEAIAGLDHIK
jgi:hypothetical protein